MSGSPFSSGEASRARARAAMIARVGLAALTALVVIPLLAIVAVIVVHGMPAISPEFLLEFPKKGMTAGGIFPAIVGTLWLVGVSVAVAAPVGVLAAVWLHEYAPPGPLTRAVQLAIVNLAGVPSIVHALFGVGAFVLFLKLGTSILSAALTMGIMTLPVVIAATREALAAVPMAFREACWNVGATRWQTVRHVVLPNAIPGILTGVILEVSRAAGETAPILFTGAAFYLPYLPSSIHDQSMALSMHLFVVSTQVPDVPDAIPFGTALVLLGTILCVNALAIVVRTRLRGRRKW
jgi:phosphate transport system permease protein